MDIVDGQNLIWLLLGGAGIFLIVRYLVTRNTINKERDDADKENKAHPAASNVSDNKIRDPVCGMSVDPDTDITWIHDEQVYYFCSMSCRGRFRTEPDKFLRSAATVARMRETSSKT